MGGQKKFKRMGGGGKKKKKFFGFRRGLTWGVLRGKGRGIFWDFRGGGWGGETQGGTGKNFLSFPLIFFFPI